MLQPSSKPKPLLHSGQILNAFIETLRPCLPLDLRATRITADDVLVVLSYASVHQTSLEATCQELHDVPSGNRLREVLCAALPARPILQRSVNTILRRQLPRVFFKGKRAYSLALDITLIPYHGQAQHDACEVVRAQAKCGTHHFHGYATVAIVHDRRRYVLALRFLQQHERMVEIVRDLLNRVQRLKIRVRRVFLDKEFYSVAVLRSLQRRQLAYGLPVPVHARQAQMQRLCRGRRSHFDRYTIHSPVHGAHTLRVAVVRRNRRRMQRRVVRWFVFAVAGLPPRMSARQVFQLYRQRFGIESCYRQLNQVRARTSSRNPALRLLFVGLALILLNLYVSLRQALCTRAVPLPMWRQHWLSLRRLARLLARAIEALRGLSALNQRQPISILS